MAEEITGEVGIEVDVCCGECGKDLETSFDEARYPRLACVTIEPCKTCMEKARDEGYEEGHEEASKGDTNGTNAKESTA